MRIGIDMTPLTYTLTGVGVYVQQLVNSASALAPDLEWEYPFFSEVPSPFLFRRLIGRRLEPKTLSRVTISPEFAFFHNRRHSHPSKPPTRLLSGRFDLFHITNAQSQFDVFDLPYVITVHDLAWMRVPPNELPKPNVRGLDLLLDLIRNANHVICDSECTRQDVFEFVGRKPDDVTTVLLAPRPGFYPPPNDDEARVTGKKQTKVPYLLAVSTIEPRKNFVRLVTAFADFRTQYPDFRLLIAGAKRSAWPDVRRVIKQLNLADHVQVLGRVSDERVRELLWGATALVYPSLYEGFGLPALEAMACGTPVVCSAAGSLGEVVGDAAIIVDPLSTESIADGIKRVASLGVCRDELVRKSIDRASRFSWRMTATQTVDIYRQILQR